MPEHTQQPRHTAAKSGMIDSSVLFGASCWFVAGCRMRARLPSQEPRSCKTDSSVIHVVEPILIQDEATEPRCESGARL